MWNIVSVWMSLKQLSVGLYVHICTYVCMYCKCIALCVWYVCTCMYVIIVLLSVSRVLCIWFIVHKRHSHARVCTHALMKAHADMYKCFDVRKHAQAYIHWHMHAHHTRVHTHKCTHIETHIPAYTYSRHTPCIHLLYITQFTVHIYRLQHQLQVHICVLW